MSQRRMRLIKKVAKGSGRPVEMAMKRAYQGANHIEKAKLAGLYKEILRA